MPAAVAPVVVPVVVPVVFVESSGKRSKAGGERPMAAARQCAAASSGASRPKPVLSSFVMLCAQRQSSQVAKGSSFARISPTPIPSTASSRIAAGHAAPRVKPNSAASITMAAAVPMARSRESKASGGSKAASTAAEAVIGSGALLPSQTGTTASAETRPTSAPGAEIAEPPIAPPAPDLGEAQGQHGGQHER